MPIHFLKVRVPLTVWVLLLLIWNVNAFTMTQYQSRQSQPLSTLLPNSIHTPMKLHYLNHSTHPNPHTLLLARRRRSSSDDEEREEEEFEYARVGRRGRYYDEGEMRRETSSSRDRFQDDLDDDDLDDEYEEIYDEDDDYDDEDWDEEDDDDEYDDFDDDEVIPNPILDSIDPDGALDRLPELFADGTFWRDLSILSVLYLFYAADGYDAFWYDGSFNLDAMDLTKLYQ